LCFWQLLSMAEKEQEHKREKSDRLLHNSAIVPQKYLDSI
jgi:uncharacterized membrane protein